MAKTFVSPDTSSKALSFLTAPSLSKPPVLYEALFGYLLTPFFSETVSAYRPREHEKRSTRNSRRCTAAAYLFHCESKIKGTAVAVPFFGHCPQSLLSAFSHHGCGRESKSPEAERKATQRTSAKLVVAAVVTLSPQG